MPRPRHKKQLPKIFALAKGRLDDEMMRDLVEDITRGRTRSRGDLNFDEANKMIQRLGGTPFSAAPKRTEQYRRQKANILHIETRPHLALWRQLGAAVGFDETSLQNFTRGQIGEAVPTTTANSNRVIEALKQMKKRGWRYTGPQKNGGGGSQLGVAGSPRIEPQRPAKRPRVFRIVPSGPDLPEAA